MKAVFFLHDTVMDFTFRVSKSYVPFRCEFSLVMNFMLVLNKCFGSEIVFLFLVTTVWVKLKFCDNFFYCLKVFTQKYCPCLGSLNYIGLIYVLICKIWNTIILVKIIISNKLKVICWFSITKTLRIIWVKCIPLSLRSKTRRRATPLLPTWIYSCRSRVTVSCALPFTTNVTISTSISQNFRSWVAIFHLRQPMVFLSHSSYGMPGLAPLMNVLF